MTLLVAVTGCRIDPGLDPSPDIPTGQALTSTQTLENALQSAYGAVVDTHLYAGNLYAWPTIMTDAALLVNPDDPERPIYQRRPTPHNPLVMQTWRWGYRVINRCNLIIESCRAGAIEDPEFAANRNRILGEALFLRALMHFELCRFYAPQYAPDRLGTPAIVLRVASVQTPDPVALSTIGAVYEQVERDLIEAATLLPARDFRGRLAPLGTGLNVTGRATGDAARALLARVHFQTGQTDRYGRALSLIDQVLGPVEPITSFSQLTAFAPNAPPLPTRYPLLSSSLLGDLFNTTGADIPLYDQGDVTRSEVIFQLNVFNNVKPFRSLYLSSRLTSDPIRFTQPTYVINPELLTAAEGPLTGPLFPLAAGDRRYALFYLPQTRLGGQAPVNKLNRNFFLNIPVIRSAELLLTRAEINVLSGTLEGIDAAVSDLMLIKYRTNLLRDQVAPAPGNARYLYTFSVLRGLAARGSADTVLAEIRRERLRELLFEPDRLHDLRRRGLSLPATGDRAPWRPEDHLPIPAAERTHNLALTAP